MANLFPTVDAGVEAAPADSAPVMFGRSYRFDYEAGEFVLTPTGKIAGAEGTDAWLEWCSKALQTERYRYLVYSRNYGQEFDGLIGLGLSRAGVESEISRMATETLMADPRTASVRNFSFSWENDSCSFSCEVANVRDDTGILQGSAVMI
ncbi:DUF2634 domain-containing protein [Cohnella zeiphila]|uniref:DUF2634 domain-containing protein n=1 Tax=Cohnella zeiphila TaxID=2761120 RepID=A0A7X0VU66_9BACL|nr:DUF2634 domain-containing protein [Cohnella zeiphila]MBB6730060.1 DUF2634 domain-containing protein [Cohnella zeiphila]